MCEALILPLGNLSSNLTTGDRLDIFCAIVALISIGMGAYRGLSAELPIGVGMFCGILAAWYAYAPAHSFFQDLSFMQDQAEFLFLLSAITVVLVTWGVAVLVTRGLRLLAKWVEKKPADYVLGTVLGVIRAFLLLLIITALVIGQKWWKDGRDVFCQQSRTGRAFAPWASGLLATLDKLCPHIEVHRRTDDPGDIGGSPPPPPPHK